MDIPDSEQLKKEIEELVLQMSEPEVSRNPEEMKKLSREHADKEQLLGLVEKLQAAAVQKEEAQTLLESEDEEMKCLAQEDLNRVIAEESVIKEQINELLIPKNAMDERNVIIEIRAGAGGEEAALFAAELFRAYARYGELHGWQVYTVSSSKGEQGGFKEVVAEIAGNSVFGTLKYERGVHRVQRVPETEKQGRIHTSTVTVAVLPEADEVDIEVKPEELRIDTYRASGAGGQHVNKTSSAIRITHMPTGTVVAVQDERSQHKNKAKAMKILRAKLLEAQTEEKRAQEAAERKEQVGRGMRSEKIRTYNFPQDRITDHRIKKSWGNVVGVMDGGWAVIFSDIKEALRLSR